MPMTSTLLHEEKVKPIIEADKLKTLSLVPESLNKGWKTWSTEAAESQLLRADKENRKAQGQGFFKITEVDISTVQEDLARDLYELAVSHREEVPRVMDEFDAHDIDTAAKQDNYERNRRQQTTELRSSFVPQPPPQSTNAEYEVNSIDDNDKDPEQEAEP